MKKNQTKINEHKIITKCIFKGLTINEIANLLNYSPTTISNRIQSLFKEYKVKNRLEFILKVFSDVIEKYTIQLDEKDNIIQKLQDEIEKLKMNPVT